MEGGQGSLKDRHTRDLNALASLVRIGQCLRHDKNVVRKLVKFRQPERVHVNISVRIWYICNCKRIDQRMERLCMFPLRVQ